jgi:hypothetical protein
LQAVVPFALLEIVRFPPAISVPALLSGVSNCLLDVVHRAVIQVSIETFILLEAQRGVKENPGLNAPYNIQSLNGKLHVTYAKVDATGKASAGAGQGFVDVFNVDGSPGLPNP